MSVVATSVPETLLRIIVAAVVAILATAVSLRLLGIRRGWGRALLSGIVGWGLAAFLALNLADWEWGEEDLVVHALAIGIPATMAVAVTLDLLARPGSLALGEQAGLVVPPRPMRAVQRRISVLRRYRELLHLARREGFGPFLSSGRRAGQSLDGAGVRVRRVLEEAGGVYIKLGQIAATRVDFLPPEICTELATLQNRVAPAPVDDVRFVLETELGTDVEKVFLEFDWEPLAAASIGQTYRARLRTGEPVVVKVQRPGIDEVLDRDLAALALLANFAQRRTALGQGLRSGELLGQFAESLREEVDFRREADAMEEMTLLLGSSATVRIPKVYRDLCTGRLLVQERFEGFTVAETDRLVASGIDRNALAERLLHTSLEQVLGVGYFHADPHPGNVFAFEDGTLGLIDFGAVGRLDSIQQAAVVDMLAGLVRRDVGLLRDGIERVADVSETASPERLERALARLIADHVRPTGAIDPSVLQDLVAMLSTFGVRLPGELVILSRALVTLDGTLRVLSPGLSMVSAATEMMTSSTAPAGFDPQTIVRDELMSALPQLRRLPDRIDRILTLTGRGDLRIRHIMDEDGRRTVRTLVNRALLGAVGAAFLVVATMLLVASEAGPQVAQGTGLYEIFGYGGLLIGTVLLLRVVAAVAGTGRREHDSSLRTPPVATVPPEPLDVDVSPPGERYFRHPGDVLRLVLWGAVAVLLALFVSVTTASSEGLTSDLGRAAARLPVAARELILALTQVAAVAFPLIVCVLLVVRRRWRRLGVLLLAGAAGAAVFALLDIALDLHPRVAGAVTSGTWVASTRFPSLAYVAGTAAAALVGKPWLSRPWKRAADLALLTLIGAMAVAGSAGVSELVLAGAAGASVGALVLVVVGSPNRRPAPSDVVAALAGAGLEIRDLRLERAEGGRAQLYRADTGNGDAFVKVYARDSRDADVLYRGYRTLLLRGPNDDWPSLSLEHEVEHEALMLMMARSAGVNCPEVEALTALPDGSMTLAMQNVAGTRLDENAPDDIDAALLDAIWREAVRMHRARIAHRALHPSNILVASGEPVIIDMEDAKKSASPRLQAIDRAELLASLAGIVGADPALASAARVLSASELASVAPFLQPLALSARTRKQVSKSLLQELRAGIATVTGEEPPALERLVRVRPRTLMMIAVSVGAFYLLLPQLADVGDSFTALRSANFGWLAVCVVMSLLTYVASAIGQQGGVPGPLPFVANVGSAAASSFVNRVTPANVGGMALNVRFMQKAGIEPAQAVTGMGLNVLAGGIVHAVLLFVFVAWAGQSSTGFKIPASSKLLVIIAVVLAIVGIVVATRWGRRLIRTHVLRFLKQSWSSLVVLSRSPLKLVMLFGGSSGVTLAYIAALAAAVAAYGGGLTFAQAGAVYLGASVVAAAAPTPGGLGAMEAALVAGLTGVGMDSGEAVAAVLSYRLATYWLPILPGWISFHVLERRNFI